jgi:hypothetical protein
MPKQPGAAKMSRAVEDKALIPNPETVAEPTSRGKLRYFKVRVSST